MDIVGKKNIYFIISIILLVPGIISLMIYGLRLSIDFTGGSRIEYQFDQKTANKERELFHKELSEIGKKSGVEIFSIQSSGATNKIIRTKPLDQKQETTLFNTIQKSYQSVKRVGFETIGPTIGNETTLNAFKSVVVASLLIVLYIAWSFRKVPHPASSWKFGLCAIAALVHDVFIVLGVFSLLGHFFHVEIDSLFVTALLTVIGFSVHDTIVVFDRIRENLRRMGAVSFAHVVNESILQTLGRSLNTSITVILVLVTMLFFGGESVRWFTVALLVGIISGTYSSIFNAAPLLVLWHEWSQKKKK